MIDGFQRAKHHAVRHVDQAPAPHGLDHLRVEQTRQGHPARLGQRAFVLASWRLYPVSIVRQQGRQILPEPIGQKQRGAVRGQHLGHLMDHALRHGRAAFPDVKRQQ
jgi:hypothetical protein